MAPGVWHALALMCLVIGVVSLMMAAMCSSAIPDSSAMATHDSAADVGVRRTGNFISTPMASSPRA